MAKEGVEIEAGASKRYRVSYGRSTIGSFDTAKEAWERYLHYEKVIRPITDRDKKWKCAVYDGSTEITIARLAQRAKQEK